MPHRALLAALLLASAVAAVPATAEPDRGRLVIEGQGNTTAALVLERDLYLRLEPPAIRGGDDYAGVLIEPVDVAARTPRAVGGLHVRAFGDGTEGATAVVGYASRLPEGRYRVTLLGDGAVRASFALVDAAAPGMTVVSRDRIPVRFLHREEPLAVGASTAVVELGGALPPGRRALQVALLRDASADMLQMCATAGRQCEQPLGRLSAAPPGETSAPARLVASAPEARSLLWAATGVRTAKDRLRAAALVF